MCSSDLDDPFPIRYGRWLGRIARLDLGRSLRTGDPVSRELGRRIPSTLGLAAATLAFTVVFSMAAGILAALREGRLLDRLIQVAPPPPWPYRITGLPCCWSTLSP